MARAVPRYQKWKQRAGYGARMMVMSKPYRGREAQQLFRKFSLAQEVGHIARWEGGLRWSFGVNDDVALMHEQGGGRLPRRSVTDGIYAARPAFVAALVDFWRKRIQQALRHT